MTIHAGRQEELSFFSSILYDNPLALSPIQIQINRMKNDQNLDMLAVIHSLPQNLQEEVYHFVEFLVKKQEKLTTNREEPYYQVKFGNPNGLLIIGDSGKSIS